MCIKEFVGSLLFVTMETIGQGRATPNSWEEGEEEKKVEENWIK